jgi:hypothetical protein
MASEIKRIFRLPLGYTATFCWRDGDLQVEWESDFPVIRKERHRRKFIDAYQAARRSFWEEVAAVLGGSILVVDADTALTTVDRMEVVRPPVRH